MVSVAWGSAAIWFGVAVLVAILVSAAIFSLRPATRPRDPQIAAHRGGALVAPENTLAAARHAIADSCDWLEIDVQESRDGQVLVFHDQDVKRFGGGEQNVWEQDAAALQMLDVGSHFSPGFHGERIPLLGQLLDACRGKIRILIELKHYGHSQQLEERVIEIVESRHMVDDVRLMSFDAASVRKLKTLCPSWKIGWITDQPVTDVQAIHADFLAITAELVTAELVEQAHRRGILVFVWTVNDPALAAEVAARGADMIITDHPAMVRQVLTDRTTVGR